MPHPAAHDPIASIADAGVAVHALVANLPEATDGAPEWVTLFPKVGDVDTRDGRRYRVDPQRLVAAFAADALDLPVDVNHATEFAWLGQRSDAVGWIKELKLDSGALKGRVEWLPEGRELLAAKKYRYVSPSFSVDRVAEGAPMPIERLRALALVTAPALARQKALASLSPAPKDGSMKTIAEALGLAQGASEADCLAALAQRLSGAVPKATHDQALADLSAASQRLAAIEGERRAEKVARVLDGALAAKKLTPAERPAIEKLCATDEGLAQVEALLAARPQLLADSGLDQRKPADGGAALSVASVAERARKLVAEAAQRGELLSVTDAVARVAGERQTVA